MARKKNLEQRKVLLELLEQGNCGKEISKILGVSKATISKRIISLEKEKLISSYGGSPKFYKLTQIGKVNLMSLRVRTPKSQKTDTPHFRGKEPKVSERRVKKTTQTSYILDKIMYIHDYKVKFKILEHGTIPAELGITKPVKNWKKRFFEFSKPHKIKIELTTKSMLIYVSDLKMPINEPVGTFLLNLHARLLAKISEFAKKYGYVLDLQNSKVVSQHIANHVSDKISEGIPKSTQHTLRLGRPAESITGPMDQEAQVWCDWSREDKPEIESNDIHYVRLLQEMPLRIERIDDTTQSTAQDVTEIKSAMKELGQFNQAITLYTKQINLHLDAVNSINNNQIKLNGLLDKFTSVLERLEKKL